MFIVEYFLTAVAAITLVVRFGAAFLAKTGASKPV